MRASDLAADREAEPGAAWWTRQRARTDAPSRRPTGRGRYRRYRSPSRPRVRRFLKVSRPPSGIASMAFFARFKKRRCSWSASPRTVTPGVTSLTISRRARRHVERADDLVDQAAQARPRRAAAAAACCGRSRGCAGRAGWPAPSVWMSLGVTACTAGSWLRSRRSETRSAVPRMLRRSWLSLLTASPNAASRVFCVKRLAQVTGHGDQLAIDDADLVAPRGRPADRGSGPPAAGENARCDR